MLFDIKPAHGRWEQLDPRQNSSSVVCLEVQLDPHQTQVVCACLEFHLVPRQDVDPRMCVVNQVC